MILLRVKGRENPVERNLKDTHTHTHTKRDRTYSTYVLKNKYNFNIQKAEHFPDAETGHLFTRLTGLA